MVLGIQFRSHSTEELQQLTKERKRNIQIHMENSVLDAETGTQMEFLHLVKNTQLNGTDHLQINLVG